jgi:DNA-directed RNA polymerase subunit omega
MGSQPLVPAENDKPAVIALREIAEGLITRDTLFAIEAKEKGEDIFYPLPDSTKRD